MEKSRPIEEPYVNEISLRIFVSIRASQYVRVNGNKKGRPMADWRIVN